MMQDELTCLLPPSAPALRNVKHFELNRMDLYALPRALLHAMSQLTSVSLGENPSPHLPTALQEAPNLEVLSMHVSPLLHMSDTDVETVATLQKLRVMKFWLDVAALGIVSESGNDYLGRKSAWREGSKEADYCDQIRWRNPQLDVQVLLK